MEVNRDGRIAVVDRNDSHPDQYLWITVDGRRFFLGVLERGMTRGQVRGMAIAFLERLAA